MKRFVRLLFVMIMVVSMLMLGSPLVSADDADPSLDCIPFAQSLAERMDVDCDYLMELHAQGIGLGQIMMAWNLSQIAPDDGLTWEELLARKVDDGLGWGQVKMAYRLAQSFDADPEELLALKVEEGLGWGQIRQAYAIGGAELGITAEQALELFAQGLGWGEIRDELGLAPGPPPWAGGPHGVGPPAWAGDSEEPGPPAGVGNSKQQGPPPWAGRPGGPGRP